MDVERVVPVTEKTMIEKWLLVFLIVGGTSLVFLICFPIDFYLYRRRKKLARERSTSHEKTPVQAYRAGQYHAQVYPDGLVGDNLDSQEKATVGDEKDDPKKQNKFVRIVNLFRKRKTEQRLMQLQMLTESKSDSSSSDHPSVLVNTNAREDTSIRKLHDTDTACSTDQSKVFTTKSVSHTERKYTEYQQFQDGGLNLQEKPSQDGVPYMARALSIIMRENEELFGPESKHLNYGSTEKINGVQMNRRIYESLNQSLMGERGLLITAPDGRHSFLSDTEEPARSSPAGKVGVSSDSRCEDSDIQSDDSSAGGHQRNIIRVRSSGNQHSIKTKSRKGQTGKRKVPKNKDKLSDSSKGIKQSGDNALPPISLPEGIVAYNLSASDDDTDAEEAANHTSPIKRSDQHLDMDEIPNDGTASPILRPITTSFSEQYLSKGGVVGSKPGGFPSFGTIDEYGGTLAPMGFSPSNYSLMDEGEISASRQKMRKKKTGDAHSLPNLAMTKTNIHNKMDYYRNRQSTSGREVGFSRY